MPLDMYGRTWSLLSARGGGESILPPPVGVPRGPLPPFDVMTYDAEHDNAPLPVYTQLREAPPAKADVRWWRGDAWGLTFPDLPVIPGGKPDGGSRTRVMTYMLDRYDRAAGTGRKWEEAIVQRHRDNLYSHISLSPQDSFAGGMCEDDYVAMSVRCRQAGLFVHHLLRSKYYTPHDDPYLDAVNRLVERLLDADAAQVLTPAWEMNYWEPDVVRRMIDHDGALIGMRAQIRLHFYPHYIAWPPPNEDSASFWRKNVGLVDGVCYQCDPKWSAGMMAARTTDCLDRLAPGGMYGLGDSGRGHPFDLTVWETIATCQYGNTVDGDGRHADEDMGNLKGFECTCSPGLMCVQGYGNGGRKPDGSPL